jgi:two-component system osmolarity sensor histidine kinase EnvZ
MKFNWLKRYLPRGLYGRAALILLAPIISLQLLVSVAFIQRHFEDVTEQMTRSLALDLGLLLEEINTAETLVDADGRIARLAGPLQLNVTLLDKSSEQIDRRVFYDLSGRIVIATLRERVAGVVAVNFSDDFRRVNLWVDTRYGEAHIVINRGRVSASNPHQFLVLMGFFGALMTLVAYFFLRNQLRPIRRLAHAAEGFGKGRIVDYRPSGATEVRSAGNAFLDMRGRIERQIEQRTLMLSGVSHDLRTPITRLRLGLSLIEQAPETEDLLRDVDDMERLLDEFLAFARSDALDDPTQTDPVALVRAVVDRRSAAHEAIKIGVVQGEGSAMIRPVAIERALDNLIGNALRYGQQAVVGVVLSDRAIKISVQDDGPGIPADLRQEALKPFVRLDTARNQDRGPGVGLGLAIAHDIARRHGGTLRLGESQDLGGLLVDLVLPR